MTSQSNALTWIKDQISQGKMPADKANVRLVQLMGIKVVSSKLPAQVRKDLNAAVKAGEIGHVKKSHLKPEVYHHINARARAMEEQARIFNENLAGIKSVFTIGSL